MDTLEILPGEGTVEIKSRIRSRIKCEICGNPAHFKHTFLLENARNNPQSTAFGRDNCGWCEDSKQFVCRAHEKYQTAPDGQFLCATFPATKQFAHLFLYWKE